MSIVLHEELRAVERWLAPELVTATSRERLYSLAATVPGSWSWMAVECRLAPRVDRADLLLCCARGTGGQRELREALEAGQPLPALGLTRPVLEEWVKEDTLLGQRLPLVWLEYDLHPGAEPSPFVFVFLDPEYLDRQVGAAASPPPRPEEARAIAEHALGLLPGYTPDAVRLDALERVLACLPPGSIPVHVVGMPQRGTQDLRMGAVIPAGDVERWLRDVEWTGSPRQLALLREAIGPGFPMIHVQIELGEGGRVQPVLAMDYVQRGTPRQLPDWERFIQHLIRLGLCDPAKGRAVLGWSGSETTQLPSSGWHVRIERGLLIKLVAHSDERLEAKAYLGCEAQYVLF